MVLKHWEETMCDNNKEFSDYVYNWQSWLIRFGWKKPTSSDSRDWARI